MCMALLTPNLTPNICSILVGCCLHLLCHGASAAAEAASAARGRPLAALDNGLWPAVTSGLTPPQPQAFQAVPGREERRRLPPKDLMFPASVGLLFYDPTLRQRTFTFSLMNINWAPTSTVRSYIQIGSKYLHMNFIFLQLSELISLQRRRAETIFSECIQDFGLMCLSKSFDGWNYYICPHA